MEHCEHHPCSCEVTGKGRFCSTECERMTNAAAPSPNCECPHDDCAGHEEID